ncbi:hypothetical protein H4W33_005979 [Kibdelosporangium phytohabitans]|nr:hypothetical protein [Kibdelosporangium phytohabitans]
MPAQTPNHSNQLQNPQIPPARVTPVTHSDFLSLSPLLPPPCVSPSFALSAVGLCVQYRVWIQPLSLSGGRPPKGEPKNWVAVLLSPARELPGRSGRGRAPSIWPAGGNHTRREVHMTAAHARELRRRTSGHVWLGFAQAIWKGTTPEAAPCACSTPRTHPLPLTPRPSHSPLLLTPHFRPPPLPLTTPSTSCNASHPPNSCHPGPRPSPSNNPAAKPQGEPEEVAGEAKGAEAGPKEASTVGGLGGSAPQNNESPSRGSEQSERLRLGA